MPSIYELKKSLSLKSGEVLGTGFIVKDVEATMDEKKPRELYNFKVHLWVSPPSSSSSTTKKHSTRRSQGVKRRKVLDKADLEGAEKALIQTAEERQIMYSSYGSPYEVHLEHVKATPAGEGRQEKVAGDRKGEESAIEQEGLIEIHALAVAKRRRDLPRLSDTGHGTSEEEEAAADDDMKRRGFRVVKAHFKSSHCPECGHEFIPGEHIAKSQDEHNRGGWAHSTCLAKRLETPQTPTKGQKVEVGN
ncbi:hypothetical protein NSK_004681 [Nannochloropsis salina CCMP1776]|uniref:Uncharacterized protein n=1 Tax=Nannochloropsis salina CCMP1776 TaxID=1027361 RepID=A0A4D9D2A1_9STRA|nr:hypothetical protein NSK_004681 [Nannochloropsis salina CCMP1776]|eukprot:TFJ83575.1 hypothetical protein NSK_004681 [Nannochloropsis salina CCMP1776]